MNIEFDDHYNKDMDFNELKMGDVFIVTNSHDGEETNNIYLKTQMIFKGGVYYNAVDLQSGLQCSFADSLKVIKAQNKLTVWY